MGDFSIIHFATGFDVVHNEDGIEERKHSIEIVYFTFFIFILASFALFMIFMNFIIAVIGSSYEKVITHAEAHDYKQRAGLIYEREINFTEKDFKNEVYFPEILIVRKKKESSPVINGW
jgi:hypothetical protein